jgi:hypothetical protein
MTPPDAAPRLGADVSADVVLLAGRVRTMDPAQPRPGPRLARRPPRGGRRRATDVLASRGPRTRVVEAPGAVALPGFHDAHLHLTQHGLELDQVAAPGRRDDGGGPRARGRGAARAARGQLDPRRRLRAAALGPRGLDRRDLDRVAPRHPVLLRSQDHHSAWANSLALRRAGVDAPPPTPSTAPSSATRTASRPAAARAGGRPGAVGRAAARRAALAARARRRGSPPRVARHHHRAPHGGGAARVLARDRQPRQRQRRRRAVPAPRLGDDPPRRPRARRRDRLAGGQGGDRFASAAPSSSPTARSAAARPGCSTPTPTGAVGVAVDGPEVLRERFALAARAGFAP